MNEWFYWIFWTLLNEYFFEWIFWILFWIESFSRWIQWKNEFSEKIAHPYLSQVFSFSSFFFFFSSRPVSDILSQSLIYNMQASGTPQTQYIFWKPMMSAIQIQTEIQKKTIIKTKTITKKGQMWQIWQKWKICKIWKIFSFKKGRHIFHQFCLLVGNSEVGIFKLTHHQKCLSQFYLIFWLFFLYTKKYFSFPNSFPLFLLRFFKIIKINRILIVYLV